MIESEHPTLLLDDIDTRFGKDPTSYAGTRGVLDEGHRPGGSVPRMVGEDKNLTMKFFDVFGPKAFAGVGSLPETIASRSIPIRLERKSRGEKIERFRPLAETIGSATRHRGHYAAPCFTAFTYSGMCSLQSRIDSSVERPYTCLNPAGRVGMERPYITWKSLG
jgi:hypothetical protein